MTPKQNGFLSGSKPSWRKCLAPITCHIKHRNSLSVIAKGGMQ